MFQTGIKEENNEKLYAKLCRKSYIDEKRPELVSDLVSFFLTTQHIHFLTFCMISS